MSLGNVQYINGFKRKVAEFIFETTVHVQTTDEQNNHEVLKGQQNSRLNKKAA